MPLPIPRIITLISTSILLAVATSTFAAPVWFWFQDCDSKKIELSVTLDGKSIYKTTFPVCKKYRSDIKETKEILAFHFVPSREIAWEGYLDEGNITKANQDIEGNIWLSGSENDALLLGVSFDSQNQIYMNTIHVTEIGKKNTSAITKGLVISTYPAKE